MTILRRLWSWLFPPKDERTRPNMGYAPKRGYVWNPLKQYRNLPCPCDSGRKTKVCCGLFEALPADTAAKVEILLRKIPKKGSRK